MQRQLARFRLGDAPRFHLASEILKATKSIDDQGDAEDQSRENNIIHHFPIRVGRREIEHFQWKAENRADKKGDKSEAEQGNCILDVAPLQPWDPADSAENAWEAATPPDRGGAITDEHCRSHHFF